MNIAVFASGSGSNAEAIISHFNRPDSNHRVTLVITNRKDAGVIDRAKRLGIDYEVITRDLMADETYTSAILRSHGIGFIALGGFLTLIPEWLVNAYDHRIVNIHPSLLPRHGGKGMYGHRVHEAVVAAGDHESGITIHYVDSRYDSGSTIFQARVSVSADDTADDVEKKVRTLEIEHYPSVIASLLG